MKKVKIGIWIIIIVLLGLVVYQNGAFFLAKESLSINFSFAAYKTPDLPVVLFFIAFFFVGWLVAYVFSLAERFSSGKQIKKLQQTNDMQQRAIDEMKKDVAALKPQPASEQEPPSQVEQEQAATPELEQETDNGQAVPEKSLPADQN
jgi:uncharacterized integral membrane protein